MDSKAEQLKNKGNEEFKKANYSAAINYYTEALEIHPSEAIYTNRAASFIQKRDFKRAMQDVQEALRLNPNFGKAYKRMFKCYYATGELDKARESINKAVELDPTDATNKKDFEALEAVFNQERVV
jgi:tetratricopeptide (TPR) repeat protein